MESKSRVWGTLNTLSTGLHLLPSKNKSFNAIRHRRKAEAQKQIQIHTDIYFRTKVTAVG